VQVFHVRDGRVRGRRGFVVDKVEDVTTGDLVEHFCQQLYGADSTAADAVPREVLVPELPADAAALAEWLTGRRGGRVDLRVPVRGDKRALLDTVARNAVEVLTMHKLKRASDLTSRSVALQEIQDALGLDEAPLRIECFDVSNLQGTEVVASMVVFEDGLARKSEYRKFNIRGVEGQNDVASIAEVITRRFRRYRDQQTDADPDAASPIDPDSGRPRRFAYPPNLVVVDGGPPQVAAAAAALDALGVNDVALCGLAKRLEEVWLPDTEYPVKFGHAGGGGPRGVRVHLGDRAGWDRCRTGRVGAHRRRPVDCHSAPGVALRAPPYPLGDLMAALSAAVGGATVGG
jgi:excinuclease ABC subunit C